jgi:hypothetical protein
VGVGSAEAQGRNSMSRRSSNRDLGEPSTAIKDDHSNCGSGCPDVTALVDIVTRKFRILSNFLED